MVDSFFMGLVYNAALLLAMVFIFDLTTSSLKKNHSWLSQVLAGIIIALIALGVMRTNWELRPGVIFDTRTVILGISGLYFGWMPTFIAMTAAMIYRINLGGVGTTAGVSEIVMASLFGLIWRYFRGNKLPQISRLELYSLGLIIHVVDLLLVVLLPGEIRSEVFFQIWLPLITVNPIAFLMLGSLLSGRARRDLAVIEMEKGKEELQTTLEATADGILAVDNNGKIIFSNRRFSELWRIPPSLVAGGDDQALLDFVVDQLINPNTFTQKVRELYGSDVVDMDTLLFKDGRIFERYSFPMTRGGVHYGRVWSFRDVTKEREIDKMKTDFVFLASHQLRTPLTGIKWFVELLHKNVSRMNVVEIQDYVKKIGESNERLIELVSDLLTTSKIENSMIVKAPTKCSLRDIFQNALDDQKIFLQDHKITVLGLEKITSKKCIEADKAQITQVIDNLINNAASYSPVGSQIELGASFLSGKVKFFVKDHGVGIPSSQRGKIFNKFYRGSNVAKITSGTGLGLYVAKSIVENHGGKIWFESKVGQGTTFFVELPLKQTKLT